MSQQQITSSQIAPTNVQTDNSNSINSSLTEGLKIQYGWGQVVGSTTASVTDAVTFPTAFTTVLGVSVCPLAVKSTSAASDITALDTGYTTTVISASAQGITTNGFTANLVRGTGTFSNTVYYGYSWIAWGI